MSDMLKNLLIVVVATLALGCGGAKPTNQCPLCTDAGDGTFIDNPYIPAQKQKIDATLIWNTNLRNGRRCYITAALPTKNYRTAYITVLEDWCAGILSSVTVHGSSGWPEVSGSGSSATESGAINNRCWKRVGEMTWTWPAEANGLCKWWGEKPFWSLESNQ